MNVMGMRVAEKQCESETIAVASDVLASVAQSRGTGIVLEPTQPSERINLIDVLRGLALFGIIVANMRGFAGPLHAYFHPQLLWHTPSDLRVHWFVDTFVQGKFISIFCFLFGVGFALQFHRAELSGGPFVKVYSRRCLGLFIIGALHQLLFWWGDVLVTYSLGGFFLIFFRKRKNKTLLIWTLALMLGPFVGGGGYLAFRHFRPPAPQKLEASQKKSEDKQRQTEAEMWKSVGIYSAGNYTAIFRQRLPELVRENRLQPFTVLMTFPLFLLGFLAYRLRIFQEPERHRVLLRNVLIYGALVGIPLNIASTYIFNLTGEPASGSLPSPLQFLGFFLMTFGRPILCFCYCAAVILLFLDTRWRPRMMPFAVIGRTALSNYLFQSVLGTTIFYGHGGGLFGKVHLMALLLLSIAVYALQVPLSRWWLSRYRFGPCEWAWRSFTYGRLQAMGHHSLAG